MSELNNYTPTPVTREEKILSGADIQPRTRMEYFLKMASENGGGNVPTPTAGDVGKVLLVNSEGQLVLDYPPRDTPVPTPEDAGSVITVNEFGAYVLGNEVPKPTSEDEGKVITVDENGAYMLGEGGDLPAYTSADIGKVLGIVEDAEHATTVTIVPEQNVTVSDGQAVELTGIDSKYAVAGIMGTLTVDGNSVEVTSVAVPNQIMYVDMDAMQGIVFVLNDGVVTSVVYVSDNNGTYNISLTAYEPAVAPAWQTPSGGGFQIVYEPDNTDLPEPPAGFTPDDFRIHANIGGSEQLFYPCCLYEGSVAVVAPTYMTIMSMGDGLLLASRIQKIPAPLNPITPASTGNFYVLTLIEPISNAINLVIERDNFVILDSSNLQWVRAIGDA